MWDSLSVWPVSRTDGNTSLQEQLGWCLMHRKCINQGRRSIRIRIESCLVHLRSCCPLIESASFALQNRLLRTKSLEGQKNCGKLLHCIASFGSLEPENVLTHRFVQEFLCQCGTVCTLVLFLLALHFLAS